MDFQYSSRTEELKARIETFMDENVYPNERLYYEQIDTLGNRWRPTPNKYSSSRGISLSNIFSNETIGYSGA